MSYSHFRLFAALSLTIWLASAPRLAVAGEVCAEYDRMRGNDGQAVSNPGMKAPDQTNPDSIKRPEATTDQTHIITGEIPEPTYRVLVDNQESTPCLRPGGSGGMTECAEGALSHSVFSPQEESLLLSVAAAESRLTSSGSKYPGAVAGPVARLSTTRAEPEGTLSYVYESGGDSAAIGYDTKGGTLYGLYQIASNKGTMSQFLQYLAAKAPDLYDRLVAAGPDNTGGKSGGKPEAWKQIAAEQGRRFAVLQHNFIRESHYAPAARNISMTCGLVVSEKPLAIREVLWSTSVQHGAQGATQIFVTAAERAKDKNTQNFDRSMIEEIYRLRSDLFGGYGEKAAAVRNRLRTEKECAVAML